MGTQDWTEVRYTGDEDVVSIPDHGLIARGQSLLIPTPATEAELAGWTEGGAWEVIGSGELTPDQLAKAQAARDQDRTELAQAIAGDRETAHRSDPSGETVEEYAARKFEARDRAIRARSPELVAEDGTVDQLRAEARSLGLPVSGSKADLAARIVDARKAEAQATSSASTTATPPAGGDTDQGAADGSASSDTDGGR